MTGEQARAAITARYPAAAVDGDAPVTVTVPVESWVEFAHFVKTSLGCRFFSFLSAVDWKDEGLEVVVKVDNVDTGLSLLMKTRLGSGVSACPSLTMLYKGADWMERECYDMFGIRFDGHHDLRRILLGDDWQGHPLLKSYAVDTPYPPYR